MSIYIRSAACISPQNTFGSPAEARGERSPGDFSSPAHWPFPDSSPVEYVGVRLKCIEPDYKSLLDPKLLRRMSRIIRMGAAAGLACLQEAGVKEPDAIVTGTAYGCVEDTDLFLSSLVERKEEMLQPAAFIQSTPNTVGAQIALMLQCTRYNNTFVHRGFSFENTLLDAQMLLQDGEAATVLTGGMDETTDISHELLTRFGLYRRRPVSNLDLFTGRVKGTIAGEGAAFFLLAGEPSDQDYARLDGISTLYKPESITDIERHIQSFLSAHAIDPDTIDMVITGHNGDSRSDDIYRQLASGSSPVAALFCNQPVIPYKHLCGEYPTSTAFALWMAAQRIRLGAGRILIYNHYLGLHHSLLLLSSAQNKPGHVTG
jgi:3-oxoacyl-[acyl-carrier-protein] synthase II